MVYEVTIKKLSNEVKSKLRSGIAITSISQCVEELVLNAIDGKATCIAVRVDLNIFRIQVVDNGCGISEEDLKFIGDRYATSKCHTLEDLNKNLFYYGFRGEALASIVQLGGVIEISSRHRNSKRTYSKLFTYGQDKGVIMCDANRPSIGTTVTIQDFMHNMPVRRKVIKESIDIESIRMGMECVALIHPTISISIRNDANNKTILQTKKAKSSLETFTQIFGTDHLSSMAEIYHSFDKYTVSGYMSIQPYHNKSLQFVYINKRYTIQTKIHSFINELFNRTSIICSKMQHIAPPMHAAKITHSPTKGIRYYGVFLLNIECPLNEYDICLDPKKTLVEFKDWHNILICIEEMMLKFVKEEGLSISLDDRFRKSEKEPLDSYGESPIPHSSSSLLQAFSNSKRNNTKDIDNCFSNKITNKDEISIKIIKAAIHSFPAHREKVNPIINNKIVEVKDICGLANEPQLKILEGKNIKTITKSQKNSGLDSLTKDTIMRSEVVPCKLISETQTKKKVCILEATNVSNCQKNSSISALKRLSTGVLTSGDQVASCSSKLIKDNSNHLSSIQELKCIYQKKLRENSLTPANNFKLIISSPEPAKIELSKYDDTKDSIDLYYSKQVNVPPKKVSHNGLSCTLSKKLIHKKKENLIQNTLNSFKFKKSYRKPGIFIKSKKKMGPINALKGPGPVDGSVWNSRFNFDPVSIKNKKNNEISVPVSSKVNNNSIIINDSPDYLINNNSINNVISGSLLDEPENYKKEKTGNKKSVVTQLYLENSPCRPIRALNINVYNTKIKETNQIYEKVNIPTYLFSEHDNGINSENTINRTCLPPNTKAQDSVTWNSDVHCKNNTKKTFAVTHKDDLTLLSESSQINKIVSNVNNFNKICQDRHISIEATKDNYMPNSVHIDTIINGGMVGNLTGNETYVVDDTAKENNISNYDFVTPFESCTFYEYLDLPNLSNSARLVKPSDNANIQSNIINEYGNKDSDTSSEHLLSKEGINNLMKSNNYCDYSGNLEEKLHTCDHCIDFSCEAIAFDKQRNDFYFANREDMPISNSLNDVPLKLNPPFEKITDSITKEIVGDINAHSSSSISNMPLDIAIEPLSQITFLDKNIYAEHGTIEASKNMDDSDISVCPIVELPYFSASKTTSYNKNDKTELNNFEINRSDKNLVANGNKKVEYLLVNTVFELPYKDCDNLESETSSSKMITEDFVLNKEDNNILPIKRKIDCNKHCNLKFPKLSTVGQYENQPIYNHHNSTKMGDCLNFNETEFFNLLASERPDFLVNHEENYESRDCLAVTTPQFTTRNILPNKEQITLSDSSKFDFTQTRKHGSNEQLPNQADAISNPILESSSVVDSNSATELSNAHQALNIIENRETLPYSKENLESCSKDLHEQVTENLIPHQCSLIEKQVSACIDLNPVINKNSVTNGSDSLNINPSSVNVRSELQPVNYVEDFQTPYMEQALDSFLNEHFDSHYINKNNGENKNNSIVDIAKLWDEWAVPKFAMNTKVLSSHNEDGEQFSSIKSYNLVHPYKFKSEMLQDCKVLGQVDNKFIAITFTCNSMLVKSTVMSKPFNLIALVDQHAADERVQLEEVLASSYDEKTQQLKRNQLTNPSEINFRPEEVRIMKAYRGAFKDMGLEFTLVNDETVLFHTLPCCLVAKEPSDKYTRRCLTACKVVEAAVREMCENIRVIGGTSESLISRPLPKPLQHIYNTIACKSAIKFGDELSKESCIKLIQMLSKCKLPFQCAHGRPSIIPVVDLNYLQSNLKKFEPKHRFNLKKLVKLSNGNL